MVCLVVLWRFRYKLSLRDLAEMFLQRGLIFTHEAVREWESKRAPLLGDGVSANLLYGFERFQALGQFW